VACGIHSPVAGVGNEAKRAAIEAAKDALAKDGRKFKPYLMKRERP